MVWTRDFLGRWEWRWKRCGDNYCYYGTDVCDCGRGVEHENEQQWRYEHECGKWACCCEVWTVWREWVDRGDCVCSWEHLYCFERVLLAVFVIEIIVLSKIERGWKMG